MKSVKHKMKVKENGKKHILKKTKSNYHSKFQKLKLFFQNLYLDDIFLSKKYVWSIFLYVCNDLTKLF